MKEKKLKQKEEHREKKVSEKTESGEKGKRE